MANPLRRRLAGGEASAIPESWEEKFQAHRRELLSNALPVAALIAGILILIGLARQLSEAAGAQGLHPATHMISCMYLVGIFLVSRRPTGRERPHSIYAALVGGLLLLLTGVAWKTGALQSDVWFALHLFVLILALCCPLSVGQILGTLAGTWVGFLFALFFGSGALVPAEARVEVTRLFMGSLLALAATAVTARLRREQFFARLELEIEKEKTHQLLLNVLPGVIADRIQSGEVTIADTFEDVTVIFADIVGFTVLSAKRSAKEVVDVLDALFTEFDLLVESHELEKIKTIGDCYMVAAGIPVPTEDHAEASARFALEMVETLEQFNQDHGTELAVRVGLHSGPVVAGVIGHSKFTYDLWGDTVNTASRMESHGLPGRVHVTREMAERLSGSFETESRGVLAVKGKGELETCFLIAP